MSEKIPKNSGDRFEKDIFLEEFKDDDFLPELNAFDSSSQAVYGDVRRFARYVMNGGDDYQSIRIPLSDTYEAVKSITRASLNLHDDHRQAIDFLSEVVMADHRFRFQFLNDMLPSGRGMKIYRYEDLVTRFEILVRQNRDIEVNERISAEFYIKDLKGDIQYFMRRIIEVSR